ncbi:MAG: hypothetical protein ACRCVD_01935 [Halioglobus sp.]
MNQNPLPVPQPPARNPTALEAEITELAAHLNAATYRLLTLIHEFDERHGWSGAAMPVGAEPVFTAPNGMLVPGGSNTRFRGNVFALTTGNRRERVEIGTRTGVP